MAYDVVPVDIQNYVFVYLQEEMKLRGHNFKYERSEEGEGMYCQNAVWRREGGKKVQNVRLSLKWGYLKVGDKIIAEKLSFILPCN